MLRTSKGVGLMLTLLTIVSSGLVRAEVVVIGHPTLPVSELDPQKVKDIWLGKIKHLAGNVPVRPIDQSPNSKVRDEFYMKSLDKSSQQVKAYWARITFTGKDNAPLTFNDDAAVRDWVASHPDAIGYVDTASVDGRVKVLFKFK